MKGRHTLYVSLCKCVCWSHAERVHRQHQQCISLFLSLQVHPDGLRRPPGPVSVRGECGYDLVSRTGCWPPSRSSEQPRCPTHSTILSHGEGTHPESCSYRQHSVFTETDSETVFRPQGEETRTFTSWRKTCPVFVGRRQSS